MALRKREREKKWDRKINVSQICSSHIQKTIKSGKRISGKQFNKIVGIFHYYLLLNMNYGLFTYKFHLEKVKFRTSTFTLVDPKTVKTYS
jgi:hypothetical protein